MTRQQKKTISNIQVRRNTQYSDYALSCEFDGARYHIWYDGETRVKLPILYKNPPLGIDRKSPEHFSTRHLSIDSAFGSKLVAEMLAYATAHSLFDKADEQIQEDARQELKRAKENKRKKLIEQAALELYEALEMAEGFISGFEDDEVQEGINEKLATIRAALDKARGVSKPTEHVKRQHGKCPVCGHYGEDCTGEVKE
jgi:hypothetical protein